MFLVFNKQKILSYFVAFTTVALLLGMARLYTNKSGEVVETLSKVKEEKNISENSILINSNWSDNDINVLLQVLERNKVNMKFYIDVEWKNNHNNSVIKIEKLGNEIIVVDNIKSNE